MNAVIRVVFTAYMCVALAGMVTGFGVVLLWKLLLRVLLERAIGVDVYELVPAFFLAAAAAAVLVSVLSRSGSRPVKRVSRGESV
jgi:predicted lysophospholipase L1 biosynthesis ABC-type transport system permease subunit